MDKNKNDLPFTSRFSSDKLFDELYPPEIRAVAERHWTPLEVARKAADFLVTHSGVRILDIGSGSGKFCFAAAHYHPQTEFTGIEQRENLVKLCNRLKKKLKMDHVTFLHKNLSEFDLVPYDHFYFYNSFYENVEGTVKIDYQVPYSEKLYDYYNNYLYKQLDKKPAGTRLVTYHSLGREVPPGYEIVHSEHGSFLKFWVKV